MGNPYNSIYDNIDDWSSGDTYYKNYIVFSDNLYHYLISDSSSGTTAPIGDAVNWGGTTNFNGKRMPNFVWDPSYNQSTKIQPKVLSVKFGDGYEQRTTAISHFLTERKGAESFVFTPPAPFATANKFICKSFSTNYVFYDNYTVSATFNQVP